jgi:hypothetical protein
MTMAARDEADIIGAQLAFHLNAGVDFVVATDHRSTDGTIEIFRDFERAGYLELIEEIGSDFPQSEWVTRMARRAAAKHGADWVINSDADEFWYPRDGNLKDVLSLVPPRYGAIRAFFRHFVARPDDDRPFFERMTTRIAPAEPLTDLAAEYRTIEKVIHRGSPDVRVAAGNHSVAGVGGALLQGWCPIELLHFPLRSSGQSERKFVHAKTATAGTEHDGKFRASSHRWHEAAQSGSVGELYRSVAVDDEELARGLHAGVFAEDVRLRNALRGLAAPANEAAVSGFLVPSPPPGLEFPRPGLVDELDYAAETALTRGADIARLQRQVDRLEARLAAHERSLADVLRAVVRRAVPRR